VPRSSDRNLLFGILALQMDFVAKAALIEGMQAWLLDKDKPLGELLCERGALTPENRSLLEPLVDAHVRQHGGDAQNSLAAMSSDGGLQASLQQFNDSDIQGSLSLLPQPEPLSPRDVGFLSSAALPEEAGSARTNAEEKVNADGPIAPEPVVDDGPGGGSSPDVPTGARDQETLIPGTLDQLDEPKMRFRILRPYAEGGLGRVHVAMYQELNREVAFKEIKFEYASRKDAQSRFVVEAEVTGGLEHPGIVPVYGLGHFSDGRPFYAMRFIRGQSLHEAIREFYQQDGESENRNAPRDDRRDGDAAGASNSMRGNSTTSGSTSNSSRTTSSNLEFRNLINRLIDVCNAIQYAHDRQVLHRDLKPSNIMLGNYGETLVVDWGLAKAIGQDNPLERSVDGELPIVPASGSQSAATQMGSTIGTPAYMPPEQAAGHLDRLGPASDVYSLGATLYEILTGQPPLKGLKIAELLKRVQSGDIPAARQLSPEIPLALNAVCRQAMAFSPSDRYASAASLADDLEAWLADEPIAAFSEPLLVRVRRWNRRHPALVSATVVSVLLAVIGLSTFSGILAGKNELLTASLGREQDARRLAEDNETRALAGEDLARMNADVATAQSGLALNTLNVVIFDLQRSLENIPGGAEVRQRLLTSVLPQLEQVSTKFATQSAVDRNTMAALKELADTIRQLGTVDQAASLPEASDQSLGDLPIDRSAVVVAERLYKRAYEIARQLIKAAPEDVTAQRDLTELHSRLGHVSLELGRTNDALTHFEDGFEISCMLAEADPSDTENRRELAISYWQLGDVFLAISRTDHALAQYENGLKITRALAEADPNDAENQFGLSISYGQLGDVFRKLGRTDDALTQYEDSLKIARRLAEVAPSDAEKQTHLSDSFGMLGQLYLKLGRTDDALTHFEDGLKIARSLAEADPNDAQKQSKLSNSFNDLGNAFNMLGRTGDALTQYEDGLKIALALAEADPSDARKQSGLFVLLSALGNVYLQLGRTDDALTQYEDGLKIALGLAEADPSDAMKQENLSISYRQLGDVFLALGRTDDALTQYKDGLKIARTLAETDPSNAENQRIVADSYGEVGDVFLMLGRPDDALMQYNDCLKIARALAEADPSSALNQENLSISYGQLGDVFLSLGRTDDALTHFEDGLKIARTLAEADPSNALNQRELAIQYGLLGDVFQMLARPDDALAQYEGSMTVLEQMIQADQDADTARIEIGVLQQQIKKCEHDLVAVGDWDELLRQPADLLPALITTRCTLLARQNRTVDISQAAAKLQELASAAKPKATGIAALFAGSASRRHDLLYNAASGYGLCVKLASGWDGRGVFPPDPTPKLTTEQRAERDRHIAAALACLKTAIEAGYDNFEQMQQDSDLAALHELSEFKALIPSKSAQ